MEATAMMVVSSKAAIFSYSSDLELPVVATALWERIARFDSLRVSQEDDEALDALEDATMRAEDLMKAALTGAVDNMRLAVAFAAQVGEVLTSLERRYL